MGVAQSQTIETMTVECVGCRGSMVVPKGFGNPPPKDLDAADTSPLSISFAEVDVSAPVVATVTAYVCSTECMQTVKRRLGV